MWDTGRRPAGEPAATRDAFDPGLPGGWPELPPEPARDEPAPRDPARQRRLDDAQSRV